jgi:SAM-dependent methyltransferase
MQRIPSVELLDEGQGDDRDIQTSLDDLWRINRWLGGLSGSLQLIESVFKRTGLHSARILDAGAGDGRMATYLSRKLRRPQTQIVALDRRLTHLQHRRPRGAEQQAIVADAKALPFRANSFDLVICNLFLHHFSGDAAVELLRSLLHVASRAVLANDLERKWVSYWVIRHSPWLTRSPITRVDGPASVRQAYTREELCALAQQTGAAEFEVVSLPCFRLGLTLWKAPA